MPQPIRLAVLTLAVALTVALPPSSTASPPEPPPVHPADLALVGGTIRSLDATCPRPEVVLVRDGRVLAIGGRDLLASHAPARTIDLGGRAVVPGLVDAHAHFLGLGRLKSQVDLRDARSYEEVIRRVVAAAERVPEGEFVLGRGWNQELWPDEKLPHHAALSAATPRHPVLLRRVDGHATLANAVAIARAGLAPDTKSPPGGEILLDETGALSGVFVDTAAELLPSPPEPSDEQLERMALAAQEACVAAGLTGMHDAGVDERSLKLLERLCAEGKLVMRLNLMLAADFDESGKPRPWLAERLARGPVAGSCDGRLTVRSVKIFLDGALGSRGAALLEPYADRPESRGLMQLEPPALRARVDACRDAGFQACVHAIGDAANRAVLDAFEASLGLRAKADHRFRVEHAQVIAPADIPRFARLGVIASVQPTHATSDMNMAGERLGEERLAGAYAWRSLLRAGAQTALGSDFPVESENPLWGIFAAVARTDHDGLPAGGWRAHEALGREEALRGFTLDAAFASFSEGEIGSLSPGKRADFVILPADPITCPLGDLVAMRPESTWIGGRQVFPEASR